MPTPEPGPVRDPAALARIMHDAAQEAFAASIDEEMTRLGGAITVGRFPWERVSLDVQRRMAAEAEAVAIAVCPPGWRIVPAAELAALLDAIVQAHKAVMAEVDDASMVTHVAAVFEAQRFRRVFEAVDAFRAALDEEEGEGG